MSETSTPTSSFQVLSPRSVQNLHERGQPAAQRGEYWAISNTSYATADSLDSEVTVLIPVELDSQETLQFLELDEPTASVVWQQFLDRQAEFPHRASVLNSAKRYVDSIKGRAISNDDDDGWVEIMRRIGLSDDFQDRIMRADVKEMRLSGSLKEWVFEMMEIRYEFLHTLDSVIQAPPMSIPRVSSQASKGPGPGDFQLPQPELSTATSDPPQRLEGHVMLFKSAAQSCLDGLFKPNGQLRLTAIVSTPPSDFSKLSAGLYFTDTFDVARKYAQWSHALLDGTVIPVEILHVAVPQHLLASTRQLHGDEWTRYVWACRRTNEYIPDDLSDLDQFQWLTGGINLSSTEQIAEMKSSSEIEVWKSPDGQIAKQYFAGSMATMRLMDECCVGKVWRTAVRVEGKDQETK